ncbi:hypothetical protein [Roseivivax marinus]|uniref:hypothetical protein n=1 Tax=Roseivivax marinus TaxID=1379903 RepID=UPI00273FF6B7|nr:hypothetical protein [Roseivivax marinus]
MADRLKALAILALGLGIAGTAPAQEARPVVFTQAHDGTVQPIASDVAVQVQLPAGPVFWEVEEISRNVTLIARSTYPSPGRVPGSVAVEVLDFALPEQGRAVIVLRPVGRPEGATGTGEIHGTAFAAPFSLTLDPVRAE